MPDLTYEQLRQKIAALGAKHAEVEAVFRELYPENTPNRWGDSQIGSSGMLTEPSIVDHEDGSITVGAAECYLYTDANFTPPAAKHAIAEKTFSLTDLDVNYLVVSYNSGNPEYSVTLDLSSITVSSVIPVNTIFRRGTDLYFLTWDSPGVGLSSKLYFKDVKLNRFLRESGLTLSESGTRNVDIASGTIWSGIKRHNIDTFDSTVDSFEQINHVSGVWTVSDITQYNNTYYDDGTDLVEAGNAKFIINWVYLNVGDVDVHASIILGSAQYNTLATAQLAQPPTTPECIGTHYILVGRIIVVKSASTASAIETTFGETFTLVSVLNHNDTTNIDGGATGEYYHFTQAQYTALLALI